jgi:predicted ATPase
MILRTLGGLELLESTFTRPKPLLMLGYLALEGARDRRHLGELFFAQAADRMNSLRTTLKRLRHEAPGTLEADGDPLRASVECDAQTVLTHLDAGELEMGIERYAGPFLAGVHLSDWSVELEEWVFATREFIASRVRGALLTLAERLAQRSEFVAASKLAERACWLEGAPDPEPEEFTRLGALLIAGESPLLGRLRDQARGFEIEFVWSLEVARVMLGAADAQITRSSLPTRGTSFVGRAIERPQIESALARTDVRLLTLVGPGGIGKTRLALEVARNATMHGDVAFVSLEAMTSLVHVPNAVAVAFGEKLSETADPFHGLTRLIAERSVLLVLDSVEHLLEGAAHLPGLLRDCPKLKLLVTSRERLGIEEEWVFPVGGLAVPGAGTALEEALKFEAVQLFAQRAKRARLSFNLSDEKLPAILRTCELVGGSPLGIELAAAWVRLLPVAEIEAEISRNLDFLETTNTDAPQRHSSVRVVFEQTWARLSATERQTLARLAVFRGGFPREAASEISGASLTVLSSLVDKSLVRVAANGRYDLHVLLGQFALERLIENPSDFERIKQTHERFYLRFSARASEAILHLNDEKRWIESLRLELENLRSAFTNALEHGRSESVMHAASAMRLYWGRTGRAREGRDWLTKSFDPQGNLEVREQALSVMGELAMDMGDYTEAKRLLEESLQLQATHSWASPLHHLHLGNIAMRTGDLETARHRYEEALLGFRESHELHGLASSLNNLGTVMLRSGDPSGARAAYEESLRLKLEVGGDVEGLLKNMGNLSRQLGHYDTARTQLLDALNGLFKRGFDVMIPTVLEGLGFLSMDELQRHRAAVLFAAAAHQREELKAPNPPAEQRELEEGISAACDALGEAEFAIAWAQGWAMTLEQAVAHAIRMD